MILTSDTLSQIEIQQLKPTINVLIVTANSHETRAVFDATDPLIGHSEIHKGHGSLTHFSLGRMGVCNIVHIQCPQGEESEASISEAIALWKPKVVIMIGVMCALKTHIKKGDVIVSSFINPYMANQKRQDGKIIRRHDIAACGPRLTHRFRAIVDGGIWICPSNRDAKAYIGEILSGPTLANDQEFAEQLKEECPQAVGLEMEGAGLRLAIRHGRINEWIMVKGVSDFGDGSKDAQSLPDDVIQPIAAAAAVSLCLEILKSRSALNDLEVFVEEANDVSFSAHNPQQFSLPINLDAEFNVCRKDYLERWVPLLQSGKVRALILHGASGSGKTWLTTALVEELKKQSPNVPVRFGCFEHKDRTPDASQLKQLLQIMIPEHSDDIAQTDWRNINSDKIKQWFPPLKVSGAASSNAFLFFDDLDGTIQISDTGDTLDRPLLHLFRAILTADSSLSLLITAKDERLEKIIENSVRLENIRDKVQSVRVGVFTDEENREYLAHFDTQISHLGVGYKDKLLYEHRLTPLLLQLICGSAKNNSKVVENCLEKIKVNAIGEQEYSEFNKEYQEIVQSLVEPRFEDIASDKRQSLKGKIYNPDLHYRVATAISVCLSLDDIWLQAITKPRENAAIEEFAISQSLLKSVFSDDDARSIPDVIENLRTLGILATVEEQKALRSIEDESLKKEVRFKHGVYLEYAYNGLIKSGKVERETRNAFHRAAAEFYEKSYARQGTLREGEYAAWHWINAGEFTKAWDFLTRIYRLMHIAFHYAQLAELRETFAGRQPLLSGALLRKVGKEASSASENNELDPDLNAANLADLAEVYYQGLDRWEDANKQADTVVKAFEMGQHTNENAWAQAVMVCSMYQFENSSDSRLPCETINTVLTAYEEVDPILLATVQSNLGIYENRMENYNAAEECYEFSLRTIKERKDEIATINKILRRSTADPAKKAIYAAKILVWDQLLEVDKLRMLSNLSRTELLNEGVECAINRLEFLGAKSNNSYLSSSQEYDYAKLNMSYYFLCVGDESEAEKWRLKCSNSEEVWFKTTKRKMEGLIRLYKDKKTDEAIAIFAEVGPTFMSMPDVRGQLFACFNATSALILELLHHLSQNTTPDQLNSLRREAALISLQLGQQRIIADMKGYSAAAKVITYTSQKFCRVLSERHSIEGIYALASDVDDSLEADAKKWKSTWRDEVEIYLLGLMGEPFGSDGTKWRPPALMPGILLMRSLSFSPTLQEISDFEQEVRAALSS